DHFFEPGVGEFIGMLRPVDSDSSNGAGINELLDTGALGSFEEIFCATNVRVVNLPRTPRPQAVIGGDVKDALDALHGAVERAGVAQIASDILKRTTGQGRGGVGWG